MSMTDQQRAQADVEGLVIDHGPFALACALAKTPEGIVALVSALQEAAGDERIDAERRLSEEPTTWSHDDPCGVYDDENAAACLHERIDKLEAAHKQLGDICDLIVPTEVVA